MNIKKVERRITIKFTNKIITVYKIYFYQNKIYAKIK